MSSDEFTRLVDAYYTPLYRFALSLTRSAADAGDLTQQTFLIWAQRGHEVQQREKAKSWLFTTLYREFLRSRRRSGREESIEDLPPGESELAAPDPDLLSGAEAGRALEALHAVDEVYRVPLTLFYLKDFSYREIAHMLEVPIGTVMSRLARGKSQLGARLSATRAAGTLEKESA